MTTMETKSAMGLYESPELSEMALEVEGILCNSPGGIGDGEDGGDI